MHSGHVGSEQKFEVVASGMPELVLAYGYSGIVKSSVVNELHKVVIPSKASGAAPPMVDALRRVRCCMSRRVFCRFCHARSRVPMVFGPPLWRLL